MIRATLVAPRAAAAAVLKIGFSPAVGWLALMLMAVGSALISHLSFALMPVEVQEFWAQALGSPIRTAILQWVLLLISVHAIHKIGRMRGGIGSLDGAVVLMAWLQFVLLCAQVVQLVALILVPPLAGILGIASMVLLLWLLTNFIAELHGFKSLGLTFVGILVTFFTAIFVMAIVQILLFGAAPVGA
jgi:hypothetical protein